MTSETAGVRAEPTGVAVSRDGTRIAYDRLGDGPALVMVAGAFSYRRYKMQVRIAEALAGDFTVVNYDRRGRGDSGDTPPYSVEREVEDLAALVEAVGGSAHVWGLSSGGVLALRAAASGVSIDRLAVYQPPFVVDADGHVPPADLSERLDAAVAAGDRGAAVRLFMTGAFGVPRVAVGVMRLTPVWSRLKAVAHTLPYDLAVMGDTIWGRPLDPAEWAGVTVPTLVMDGGSSPAPVRAAADALAGALPDARRETLPRQKHVVKPNVLAPALRRFFDGGSR